MVAQSVTADDGSYRQRTVTIEGRVWQINDLTGDVFELSSQEAETLPDYGASLKFAGANTLENGTIGEAYDFEHEGQKSNLVFVFLPDKTLVGIIMTIGANVTAMDIVEMKADVDLTLFDALEK